MCLIIYKANYSMKGRTENNSPPSDIISAFRDKIKLRKIEVNKGKMDKLLRTAEIKNREKGVSL